MAATNLDLAQRAKEFELLISSTEIADANGDRLPLNSGMFKAYGLLSQARERKSAVFVIGNGGSAGVASHAVIDFLNVAKLNACTLHEPATMTCLANDYGYEYAFARQVEQFARPMDVLVAISSSGKSKNIILAVEKMKELGGEVITLTGFLPENPLRRLGHINMWLDSKDYGMVEVGHQFLLHNLADRFNPVFA